MSLFRLIRTVAQGADESFNQAVAVEDADVYSPTPRQFTVLEAVQQNEGASQTGLVEATGVDRSTLADVVRRLLKFGVLQRRRTKEDARAYAVRLTDDGEAVLKEYTPRVRAAEEAILAMVAPKDRDAFVRALKAIDEGLAVKEEANA